MSDVTEKRQLYNALRGLTVGIVALNEALVEEGHDKMAELLLECLAGEINEAMRVTLEVTETCGYGSE